MTDRGFARQLFDAFRFMLGTISRRPQDACYAPHFFKSMLEVAKKGYWDAFKNKEPWVSYSMKRWLDQNLSQSFRVFEFGSGGSTAYFGKRVGEVHSVEHSKAWFLRVKDEIDRNGLTHCKVQLFEPEASVGPNAIVSSQSRYAGLDFTQYVNSIRCFQNGYFDLIFIDGRARAQCLEISAQKLKAGGFMVLDNGDRREYQVAIRKLEDGGWSVMKITGLTPGILAWDTTFILSKFEPADVMQSRNSLQQTYK